MKDSKLTRYIESIKDFVFIVASFIFATAITVVSTALMVGLFAIVMLAIFSPIILIVWMIIV